MDEILWCYHSNETSSAVLSHGTIYLACSSNFSINGWNFGVLEFKWNLFGRTFCKVNIYLYWDFTKRNLIFFFWILSLFCLWPLSREIVLRKVPTILRLSSLLVSQCIKGFIYRLSHNCHYQVTVSISWVGLFVPPWLLVIGVSRTSLMVGRFQSKALLALLEEETFPSVVCCGSNWLLCCLIVGINA